jgi:hypothetical protein
MSDNRFDFFGLRGVLQEQIENVASAINDEVLKKI